jgi:hypothetical protein
MLSLDAIFMRYDVGPSTLAEEFPKIKIFCVNPDMTATRFTGYEGRPPSDVAEAIFRAVSGRIKVAQGGDMDVWRVIK